MLNNAINRYLGALCYPLISLDLVHNIESLSNKEKKVFLNEQTLNFIRTKYVVNNYDEIKLYVDKFYCYFESEEESKNSIDDICMKKIEMMSRSFISERDGKIVYKYWENDKDVDFLGGFSGRNKMHLFQNLNRWIPMDVMVSMYMASKPNFKNENLHNFYGQVNVSDLMLDRILEDGLAENHMHSGVSIAYFEAWENLMSSDMKDCIDILNNISYPNFKINTNLDKKYIKAYILIAKILRVMISLEIVLEADNEKKEYIEEMKIKIFKNSLCRENNIESFLKEIKVADNEESIETYFIKLWENILDEVSNYKYLFGKFEVKTLIYDLFNVNYNVKTYSENIFLMHMMKIYLDRGSNLNSNTKYKRLKPLFLKYLRVKNNFFNMMVQQNNIKGLDNFKVYYGAHSKFHKNTQKNFWEQAMRSQFQNTNIKKVEFRMSVDEKESVFKNELIEFLRAYYEILKSDYCEVNERKEYEPVIEFPKVGIVYHLIKSFDGDILGKCYDFSLEGKSCRHYLHFGELKNKYRTQVEYIRDLRNSNPIFSKYIVGLDAASGENDTPIWVFKDAYELVRDSSSDNMKQADFNSLTSFQSLGFTMHAGEDFRHLLSGLRRMDETIKFLKFRAGDRIGHGIALGVSAIRWKEENPVIVIPQIEMLENYLWAYDLLSSNYEDFNPSIITFLENKIYKLFSQIYSVEEKSYSVEILLEFYRRQFIEEKDNFKDCNKEEYCDLVGTKDFDVKKLLKTKHCKLYLLKMYKPINVEVTDQDVEIINIVQKMIKENFSKTGIVLEVNPTSNHIIGFGDTMRDHHAYKLSSLNFDSSKISICVNSDDPSVFNTNVSNELAYLYHGMVDKGICKDEAISWIQKLRENGMRYSFIRRRDTDKKILMELKQILE